MQQTMEIQTPRGVVRGVLHPANEARGAMVMVGGAGGGTHGPGGSYEELGTRLQRDGVTAVRLEFRQPNYLEESIYDVLSAIKGISGWGMDRVVLVGWSFGGAVVISAGAASEAVVGVATVASQTYSAGAVGSLGPRRVCCLFTARLTACCRLTSHATCTRGRVSLRSWCSTRMTATV